VRPGTGRTAGRGTPSGSGARRSQRRRRRSALAREIPAAGCVARGDARAVGRPRRSLVDTVRRRQPHRLTADGWDDENIEAAIDVPVVVPPRRERDVAAVRSPRRLLRLVVAARQLHRLGRAVPRNDEDLAPPALDPADVVELVLEPGVPPPWAPLLD